MFNAEGDYLMRKENPVLNVFDIVEVVLLPAGIR
jgi:hypothetical protein